jgi:hypothetical protein
MEMKLAILFVVATILMSVYGYSNAFASHAMDSSDKASCRGDGHDDGRNSPFSQELYDICGDTYYDAFIEGCMSVEGNARDDCESATDAGE